jgi:predicted lipoprotein with Yx(FWY)xxD motif
MRLLATSLLALACASASFTASAQSAGVKTMDGILVDAKGMTVYTFDKDTANSGKSVCNGPCAKLWPPVAPMGMPAAPYSTVTRDDGSAQLAYQGKPCTCTKPTRRPATVPATTSRMSGTWSSPEPGRALHVRRTARLQRQQRERQADEQAMLACLPRLRATPAP